MHNNDELFQDKIYEKIEILRTQLIELVSDLNGECDTEVLRISGELDELIVKYMKQREVLMEE